MRLLLACLAIMSCAGGEAIACADKAEIRTSVFIRIAPDGDIVHGADATARTSGLVHIPGLAFVPGAGGEQARDRVMATWAGREITISLTTPTDRWGRIVGHVTSAMPSPAKPSPETPSPATLSITPPADLGVDLLVAGGYMLVPEDVPAACREAWRKAEHQALDIRAGIWGQTPPSLLSAAAPEGASLGQRIVIRGRISSVGVRTARVYINFGGPGSGAATASMPPVIWRKLAERGFTPETLRGRNALVRGHVASMEPRWMLDVDNAASIEIE